MDGEVVREVTAELPGELVEQLLTSADPSQPVQARFSIATESGELRRAELTGPFFARRGRRDVHGRPERLRGRCRDHRAAHRLSRRPRRARRRPGLPLVVLATLAVLVTAADTYVVVLALPDILTGVGVGLDELQRATPIVGGFLLGYTATLPLLGRLADLRGRVPVLVGCLLLFALGSLLTATADSLGPAVARPGTAGHRRRRTGAGHARPRRRPLATGAAVAAAGRGRCGAGGRCRAGPAGRRGRARRGRLAGHLLAQPAARTGPGGRRRGVGPGPASRRRRPRARRRRRPSPSGSSWPRPPRWPRTSPSACSTSRSCPRSTSRPRWSWWRCWPPPGWWSRSLARPEGAVLPLRGLRRLTDGGRRAGVGPGRRGARQPGVGLRRSRPGDRDRGARRRAAARRAGRRCGLRRARAADARSGAAAARAPAGRGVGRAAGQPARGRRAGGRAGRRPAVRPRHDDARRPARRGPRAAPAARRRAGGGGGRRLALPVRWHRGSSRRAGWRWPRWPSWP